MNSIEEACKAYQDGLINEEEFYRKIVLTLSVFNEDQWRNFAAICLIGLRETA